MKQNYSWRSSAGLWLAGAMRPRKIVPALVFLITLTAVSQGRAFSSLFERVRQDATLAAMLPVSTARAEIQDGPLFGIASENIRRLPDGRLRVDRTRRYTYVRHPETGRFFKFPEPWEITSTLILTSSLRLVSCDTHFDFKRNADNILGNYRLSEHHEWLFEKDRSLLRATERGNGLVRQDYRAGKLLKSERYDYPSRAMPIEILGLLMGIAVQRRVDQFDFDLIVPDGSTHGVRAQVRRTRDLRGMAKGYRVPTKRLTAAETLAVVDMHLASPIKSLFFPHHFYLAYSDREPWKLMMMFGGDPDETIQAFRVN
jgi:hypothetical protein